MLRLLRERTKSDRLQWSKSVWLRFHAESAARSAYGTVVVTILGAILLLAWAPGDFEYFPEHAVRFTYYRIASIVWGVAMVALAVNFRHAGARYIAMWVWFLGWGAQSAAMIPATPEQLLSHTFVFVMLQLGSLGFIIWSWKWAFTMSFSLVGIGEIALWSIPTDKYEVFAAHGYLLTGAAFSVLFAAVKYRGAREQFDQRIQLEEEKERSETFHRQVASMRQERLNWLENLARFLRHELKNQVVAVSTSLELTKLDSPGVRTERYVGRAQRSLDRMRRLVESATEATSLEAAMATEGSEQLDLSQLIAERVSLFREVNPQRRVHADIQAGIVMDGNEDRLTQLLDKLLENAIDHGSPEGESRLSLNRVGGDASLVIENDGDPLPVDKDGLFDAFVTVGKQESEAPNVGLGLFVAKAIAESHGGTIEARDRANGAGACFEVRLPAV